MTIKLSDNEKILDFLAYNDHITRDQCLGLFRIRNATARITDLRNAGWRINTEMCVDYTGKRYARWSLDGDQADLLRTLGIARFANKRAA